jgi:DNA repair photolyase
MISITTLNPALGRKLEPRASRIDKRLKAIRTLADAGIPVGVNAAPIIPGLNDAEIPAILAAAKEAGASGAGYVMLRLPLNVAPVFTHWLRTHRPLAAERIESLIREMRSGKLNDSQFGSRMRGKGPYAEGIKQTFELFVHKLGLDAPWQPLDCSQFRPPELPFDGQKRLF